MTIRELRAGDPKRSGERCDYTNVEEAMSKKQTTKKRLTEEIATAHLLPPTMQAERENRLRELGTAIATLKAERNCWRSLADRLGEAMEKQLSAWHAEELLDARVSTNEALAEWRRAKGEIVTAKIPVE